MHPQWILSATGHVTVMQRVTSAQPGFDVTSKFDHATCSH